MNFNDGKVPEAPLGGAVSALLQLGVLGSIGLYTAVNNLYNVKGGHRAIMFNHFSGIKDKSSPSTSSAANFNIALEEDVFTSLTFGREFTAAIVAKQLAAQEAERAKFVVGKAKEYKKIAAIRVRKRRYWTDGEATSAQLIGQATRPSSP
ncbi:hypothetical protein MLD38_025873 [Melastoma candidum]|uniref:Uncharacterized protein n=1 Tax=Melastoma candidum TaxID=119954 RepID=A0ACB9NYK9_9MYRT|nr:hypothetical protein MLD38_025873 [Melastoma candidum]